MSGASGAEGGCCTTIVECTHADAKAEADDSGTAAEGGARQPASSGASVPRDGRRRRANSIKACGSSVSLTGAKATGERAHGADDLLDC